MFAVIVLVLVQSKPNEVCQELQRIKGHSVVVIVNFNAKLGVGRAVLSSIGDRASKMRINMYVRAAHVLLATLPSIRRTNAGTGAAISPWNVLGQHMLLILEEHEVCKFIPVHCTVTVCIDLQKQSCQRFVRQPPAQNVVKSFNELLLRKTSIGLQR